MCSRGLNGPGPQQKAAQPPLPPLLRQPRRRSGAAVDVSPLVQQRCGDVCPPTHPPALPPTPRVADFLRSMLQYRAADRATAEEALAHPFFHLQL